ncbi:hyphal anastamosis-8 protein [Rutstroemia sp. NJR-2017a WRK4]|nr:hyphal anastamosis-8 protein [Rutstroemia sp. NJR-2017a WRK4]
MSSPPTEKRRPTPLTRERTPSTSSTDSSSTASLKVPRTPRFAEATTVYSPIDDKKSPFADPPRTQAYMAQPQPSDIGFGYISQNDANRHSQGVPIEMPLTPSSPLKSAMKVPGTPGRGLNPLSPTFREEQVLEKHEEMTEKEQAKDLKVKTRVRVAKLLLRCVNFSCSLIVLAMVSTTFSIFNATKALPPRNNLPAWADGTKTWPQKVVLSVSCVSLALCLVVFYNYWKGGHRRAEKVAVYYTLFAVAYFIFSTIMWALAAGILQGARNTGNNKDMWGWACVDNKRRQLFQEKVDYALVCRLQSWSLICCIIEIVLELITIVIYGIVFYRYYSKQRLRKSMAVRDRARSDLYLAQLRTQSAPNTPGFGPMSPSFSKYAAATSPRFPPSVYNNSPDAEEGTSTRFVEAKTTTQITAKPFTLQAPPIKVHSATPKTAQNGFEQMTPPPQSQSPPPAKKERVLEHVDAAPGEQTYAAVPIPGAYAGQPSGR